MTENQSQKAKLVDARAPRAHFSQKDLDKGGHSPDQKIQLQSGTLKKLMTYLVQVSDISPHPQEVYSYKEAPEEKNSGIKTT